MTTDVSVDEPSQNPPPEDVLDACNWNYSSTLAASVFVHGSLTVHYGGTIAEPVSIAPKASVRSLSQLAQLGAGTAGMVGIQSLDGDSWTTCTGDLENNWSYNFQPGESQTVQWWADLQVLSNSHPSFTDQDKQQLAIQWHAMGGDQINAPATVSGPGAAICGTGSQDQMPFLLLYNSPPATFSGQDVNGTEVDERCATP